MAGDGVPGGGLTFEACPFDGYDLLARTPYLVVPKMAIQAMPMEWRKRLAALLKEAYEAGLETPEYHVFRGGYDEYTRARVVNEETGFVRIVKGREDPWAFYRHAGLERLKSLCPKLKIGLTKWGKINA